MTLTLIITILTIIFAVIIAGTAFSYQIKYSSDTNKARIKFENFFKNTEEYSCSMEGEVDPYPQIDYFGKGYSDDMVSLIKEINIYLYKTRGTSDYEFIRNKVERRLESLYDDTTARLSFPVYCGLMGTFAGVILGIFLFLVENLNGMSEESVTNLLIGVIVAMFASFCGLFITTNNNSKVSDARKKVDKEKNKFYDFIQTEITRTASASLVTAITRLHFTVDKFEPAFSKIIDGFKSAFNDCTRAFGNDFKKNVETVNMAVEIMGENMDKINENISLQNELLDTLKSNELTKGLDKYVEAANHFVSITMSLNKFEEARRMMLAAAQESIKLQNQYNESLQIPREVAVRINQILDRIKSFEENINNISPALVNRDMLGNDAINAIRDQINGIAKKGRIADKYLGISDGKLEELYKEQTKVISEMNTRYKNAIEGHIDGFEQMLTKLTEELETRHKAFMNALEDRFSVEDVRQEFTNLRKLEDIEKELSALKASAVTPENLQKGISDIQKEFKTLRENLKPELESIKNNTKNSKGGITLLGIGKGK